MGNSYNYLVMAWVYIRPSFEFSRCFFHKLNSNAELSESVHSGGLFAFRCILLKGTKVLTRYYVTIFNLWGNWAICTSLFSGTILDCLCGFSDRTPIITCFLEKSREIQ